VTIIGLDIVSDEIVGEGGFLAIRRIRLRNRRDDGSFSDEYICDFVHRPKGNDAVVVALYTRDAESIRVLVRDGLRPALMLGRDDRKSPFFTEVVAGILEAGDVGEAGVRARAVAEAFEEAGHRAAPADVEILGASMFPTAGSMSEKFWLVAIEVSGEQPDSDPPGDGSPMEEGAVTRWLDLEEAISACESGAIADMKTELTLRRLRDRLARG